MLQRALAVALCAIAAFATHTVSASIYPVTNQAWIPPFQHAEKMFATDRGPILARAGNSSVTFDLHGVNITDAMNGWRLVVFLYHVANYEAFATVADKIELLACSNDPNVRFDGMSSVQKFDFPVVNATVDAYVNYAVVESGWTDAQVFVCSTDEDAATELLAFNGTMTVENPFGLLPAPLYGLLPFSGLLALGYAVLDVFFATLLVRHWPQRLGLHFGILFILTIGLAAAATWCFAFYVLNTTGQPVCCPYPTTFLIAVILDAVVRTLARIILLVACLGYGIVRDQLRRLEVAAVAILAIAYFVSGVGDEVTRGTSSGAEFRQKPTLWSFAQLICNLVFILWIHVSLERILKLLNDQKQFAKRAMYKSLAYALASFILFFTVLTIVAVCSRFGVFEWDVEWEWMQLVAWPVLNFTVSAAMGFIWRPTKNSSQFAFSMQLPMTDDGHGLEMTAASHDSSDENDAAEVESDDDDDVEKQRVRHQKASIAAIATAHGDDSDDDDGV